MRFLEMSQICAGSARRPRTRAKSAHSDLSIFCTRREVLAVGTETYTPDVQVTRL